MDSFANSECKSILDKLEKKPIMIVISSRKMKIKPEMVHSKLESNGYASLFDFSLDLLAQLEEIEAEKTPTPEESLVIDETRFWIQKKIANLPRNVEEKCYFAVQKQLHRISAVFRAMSLSDNSTPESSISIAVTQPRHQVRIGKDTTQASSKTIEILQQRIEHLKKPSELRSILAILQQHIPSVALSQEVVIDSAFITKSCADDLRAFLNSVNA